MLRHVAVSRALDDLEEFTLLKDRKVLYQFSARGHDLTQVLLSTQLTGAQDGVGGYYRSRPLLLGLGLPVEEALSSTMMRAGGMSDGRDIGVVFNMPRKTGACVLPVCGGVGAQYTPAVGWAQALRYRQTQLGEQACKNSIAVAHGGEASTATNGFWAALNIVTTERLPFLFFIEDNGYGISVTSQHQTPGGNIAHNLQSFRGLRLLDGDGSDPLAAAALIQDAVAGVRSGGGPALIRLVVPRLSGHSGQDTQTYKSAEEIAAEKARDPLTKLREQLVPHTISAADWDHEISQARALIAEILAKVERRAAPDPKRIQRYVFSETNADGSIDLQQQGGLRSAGIVPAPGTERADASRSAHQPGDRRAPHAGTRACDQSAHAGLWRRCRTQGRRACGHLGVAGAVRRRARVRHQPVRRRHHRPRRRHGRRRAHAGARDSISQVRGPRGRAAQ